MSDMLDFRIGGKLGLGLGFWGYKVGNLRLGFIYELGK